MKLLCVVLCAFIATAAEAQSKQLLWASVNYGLAVADFETAKAFQHEPTVPGGTWCYENNSLYGSHTPRRIDFYLRGLTLDTGINFMAWGLKRCHKHGINKLWPVPLSWITQAHVTGIISNVRCK